MILVCVSWLGVQFGQIRAGRVHLSGANGRAAGGGRKLRAATRHMCTR